MITMEVSHKYHVFYKRDVAGKQIWEFTARFLGKSGDDSQFDFRPKGGTGVIRTSDITQIAEVDLSIPTILPHRKVAKASL